MARTSDHTGETVETLFAVLADADCRTILAATTEPRTALELSEACDIPSSTVYRKLEKLRTTPLLRESVRLESHGKHPTQFQRCGDRIQVVVPDVRVVEAEGSAPEFATTVESLPDEDRGGDLVGRVTRPVGR